MTRVRNSAKNPIVFRALFFVHLDFSIVHYSFALELTYISCGCFILAFYDQKFLVGVKFDRFLHPEIIFRGVKVECKSFQEKLK